MSKNREILTIGHLATKARPRVTTEPSGVPMPNELAQIRDEELQRANRERVAALSQDETPPADPGTIVGLDGFSPSSETPKNGDPERPDPDPS